MKKDIKTDVLIGSIRVDDAGVDVEERTTLANAGLVGQGNDGEEIYLPLKTYGKIIAYGDPNTGLLMRYCPRNSELSILRQYKVRGGLSGEMKAAHLNMKAFSLRLTLVNE